ncbi:MAG: hypothetical protein M3453_04640 [Pseudomonadota bacterium]|nr:hypothetical protein [Pseudomonadota bacterium]
MSGLRPPQGDIGIARVRVGVIVGLLGIFGLLLVALALLARLGLDTARVPQAASAAALGIFVLAAFMSHGRRPADYYVADRDVQPIAGGLASAAGLAGFFVIALIGGATVTGEIMFAWALGALVGLVLLAFLIAPGLRRFGGYTAGDFLAARFGMRGRLATSAVALFASLLILLAALKIAGPLLASLFGLTAEHGLIAAAVLTALTLLPGGFRSVAAAQVAQYLVIALSALAPATYLAVRGDDAGPARIAAGSDPGSLLTQLAAPLASADMSLSALPVLLVAAGLAALAPMLAPVLAAPSGRAARSTMLWTIGLSLLLLAAGVLLAGALAGAVGAEGFEELLADPIAAALLIASLPSVLSGLITAGALAALLATAQASLLSGASSLSHDLWDEMLDRKGPTSRRVFLARLAVAAVAAGAVWLAPSIAMEPPALLLWALAIAAAGNLAPLLLGLWWPRCNETGAAYGATAGFLVAGWGFLHDVGFFPWSEAGAEAGFGAASAAGIAIAVSFLVAVGVSLMTPAPIRDVKGLLAQIRSSRGRPVMRERPA